MIYINNHCHSQYSLLDGLSSPEQIAERIAELNQPAGALTDHGSVSGTVQFYNAMKKRNLKPLLGIETYISSEDSHIKTQENRKLLHQVIIAKNLNGWHQLLRLVSESNNEDNFYYRPRLDLEKLAELCDGGNLISFSGHLGSILAVELQKTNYDINAVAKKAKQLEEIFQKGNFFIEIQLIDAINNPECIKIAQCLREVGKKINIDCISTADSHYAKKEQVNDHRLLLCTNLKTTFNKIAQQGDSFGMKTFFQSEQFYIPSTEEMCELHKDHLDEIATTEVIANMCEDYDILCKPQLPKYKCPEGFDEDTLLRQLCRDGWKKKGIARDNTQYIDRVKHELNVLQGANLSSYFLIVQDILKYVKNNGWMAGPGRGSAAGCLVSYLLGITQIDPIKYNLIFERFYNSSRAGSMPDIDADVPTSKRDQVIDYIKEKYGKDNVAQIVTFGALKGRSAIKAVLRSHDAMSSFDEMNRLTEHIPDEAKISSDLQEMQDETGESSIIRWALENRSKKLESWCYLDKEGVCQGPLSKMFEQAIRMEGTLSVQGKHAAGVIVSPHNLYDVAPMIRDPHTKKQIVGFDLNDSEKCGMVKIDILGLSLLDKVSGVKSILKTGDIIDG